MKILNKEEVDEAAKEHVSTMLGDVWITSLYPGCNQTLEEVTIEDFKAGVEFAESKLQDLACNFARYCTNQEWTLKGYTFGKNTEELFEQFLLDKLDKQVDNLLESETTESLTNYLINKRNDKQL